MNAVQLNGAEVARGAASDVKYRGEAEFNGQNGAGEVPLGAAVHDQRATVGR